MGKKLQVNTLFRYKNIRDLYLKYKTEDVPDTVVLRKYIYPVYPISRTTLNTILNTPIDRELNKLSNKYGISVYRIKSILINNNTTIRTRSQQNILSNQ